VLIQQLHLRYALIYTLCTAEAPSIRSDPYGEISLAVGKSKTLQCHVDGAPAPVMAWYRGLFLPNSTDTLVTQGSKMQLQVTVLKIWSCFAEFSV